MRAINFFFSTILITAATTITCHAILFSEPLVASIHASYPNCYGEAADSTELSEDSGLRFRLPVLDSIIFKKRRLQVLQAARKQWLFVLHGRELYQVFIRRQQTSFSVVGLLDDAMWKSEHVDAEIISWHDYLLLVLAFKHNLVVYQIDEETIVNRGEVALNITADSVPIFETVQQLAMPGSYRNMLLAATFAKNLLLILVVDDGDVHSRIRTFHWMNTYFNAAEELQVPKLSLIKQQQNYVIIGQNTKDGLKTVITIYEIKSSSTKLIARQALTVDAGTFYFTHLREKNYFIACPTKQVNCQIYRMSEGHYNLYRDHPSKRFGFNQFIAGPFFLVGSRENKIIVVPNARLNCRSILASNNTDVSAIVIHINQHGRDFIVVVYDGSTQTILRAVEIEDISGEVLGQMAPDQDDPEDEMDPLNPEQHIFENTVGRLRSILLQHNAAITLFRKISKLKSLRLRTPITVRAGKIDVVRVVGEHLQSPVQLLKRVERLTKLYGVLHRPRRGVDTALHATERTFLKVSHLRVDNLIYSGEILKGFYMNLATKPLPTLSIRPPLRVKNINTPNLLTPPNFGNSRQPGLPLFNFNTERSIRTQHLNVRSINKMPWSKFYKSLFLKNRDNIIEGRLIMQAATKVHTLKTVRLNDLEAENLFNLVKPQVVRSDLLVSSIRVSDLQAERVNNLDFANDIVFRGLDGVIKSPVIIHQLSISGDILMGDSVQIKRSNTERRQQAYTGRVVINGTLIVRNLLREGSGEVVVNGQPVSAEDLEKNYLLHRTYQDIKMPFRVGHARLTAPGLNTSFLNGHPTEQHLLNTAEEAGDAARPLFLIFMSAVIGNQLINSEHRSRLANLSTNAVRQGDVANVTGAKIFQAPFSVNHLMTFELNEMPVSDLVLKTYLQSKLHLKGTKHFDHIKVLNTTNIEQDLKANHLNSLPLNELLNRDYRWDKLNLPHQLLASNVVFRQLNGVPFEKLFANLDVQKEDLLLHKNLVIDGNAQFSESLHVETINNVAWSSYLESLVRHHEPALIQGQKHFLKEVVITKVLNAPTFNDVNLDRVFANVLSRRRPQVITGSYSFGELHVSNVDVTVINDMPTAALIDTLSTDIVIEGDIVVPALIVHGDVIGHPVGHGVRNWSSLTARLQQLHTQPWRNLYVVGNARFSERAADTSQNTHILAYLKRNAVTSTDDQVISGNVRLRRPLISRMTTKTAFPKDIDLAYIAKDGLFRNASLEQVVTAPKSFLKPFQIKNMEAMALVACNQLNDVDVLRLNASLYRLSSGEAIRGPLHFANPVRVGYLAVRGTVNGVRTEQIYNHQPKAVLPPSKMTQLNIAHSLQLQDINDMSLDFLLQNRVTKHGAALEVFGFLTFEDLVLGKEILLQTINGISIDDLVLKTSVKLQAITGRKVIEGDLILSGPAHVMRLNGRNLIDAYQSSIFTNLNYHFEHLAVDHATFEHGLQLTNDDSVHVALARPPELTASSEQRARLNAIEHKLAAIESKNSTSSKHLLYLDYDFESQILWHEANESITETFDFETQRFSACKWQVIRVQKSASGNRFFLTNITITSLRAELNGWKVNAENLCCSKYQRLRSKITLTSFNLTKTLGLPRFVKQLELFEATDNNTYLMLHAVDSRAQRNEVRLLQLGRNDVADVQSFTLGVGTTLRFFQPRRNHSLLVSSALMQTHPAVSIYMRSATTHLFELAQIILGDYDIFEYVQVSAGRWHLILSCVRCRRISVYEIDIAHFTRSEYSIFQFIKLNRFIDKLLPISLGDGSRYLLMLSMNGKAQYHLYKFSGIQGWLPCTHGYFDATQLVLPLLAKGGQVGVDNSLLLLCGGSPGCSLVKAHVQRGLGA